MEITEDRILNGKIKLLQPKDGYRVAIDPIILSSFIDLKPHMQILDVGCGVGAISLILKSLEKSAEITAIDLNKEICEICRRNSQMNSLNIEVINEKIEDLIENDTLKNRFFDRVITNPPFFRTSSSRISDSKRLANFETVDLSNWITCCLKKLKNDGIFSIIHDATRTGDIICALNNVGSVEIIPLFPKIGKEAKRVVINCKKNCKSGAKILQGLVVHNDDGSYSETLNEILTGNFHKS